MMDTLLLPFQFDFMRNAFLIGALVAVPTALLSCLLVLKGWALMGDAVSHAVLPGIVLAYTFGAPLLLGAFTAGLFTAIATGYISTNSRVRRDTVMGVVYSGMFAVGVVLSVAIPSAVHLDHILFGNILGVGADDLRTTGLIAAVVTVVLIVKRKDLMLDAFDPIQARVSGLPVNLLHYGLLTILALTIVATLSATGLILSVGLLIAPGAIAFLLTRSFAAMLRVAAVVCMTAMMGGTYLSFFLDSAPAPTVILILAAMFVAALIRGNVMRRVG